MENKTSPSGDQLFCPLMQLMRERSRNTTEVNWILVSFHGLLSCLGILENALIIWVVGFRLQRRTVASVWVLNLAMSDFLATLTLPLFTLYIRSSHSWELGTLLCKTQASIFFMNMFVSAFLLAAISLDRCILVVKPVWSKNHRSVIGAWKVCALAWLWAAINTFPFLLFRSVTERQDKSKLCYHNFALYTSSEETLVRDCRVGRAATAISKLLLAFLVPLVVIAGSYIQICNSLKKRGRRRRRQQSTTGLNETIHISNNGAKPGNTGVIVLKPLADGPSLSSPIMSRPTINQKAQNQLSRSFTKMVTFVIAAFTICWAPYHIFCMIEVSAQYNHKHLKLVESGLYLATTLAFLNPLLNPILYVFSCPNFCVTIRQSLGAVFDGLVEEGGGLLTGPGRGMRSHIRRKSSHDVGVTAARSPKQSHSPIKSPKIPHVFTPSHSDDQDNREDSRTEQTGQELRGGLEEK